jgi:microsomal epoxide hydrolase
VTSDREWRESWESFPRVARLYTVRKSSEAETYRRKTLTVNAVNFCEMGTKPEGLDKSSVSEIEKKGLERYNWFLTIGRAYANEHASRPSTIGFVLSSNPLALLAWIGEKFIDWSDTTPSIDTILESVTLYWVTETMPRSIYPYRQLLASENPGSHDAEEWHIHKPFGFSWFPQEIAPMPKAWVERTGDLIFHRQHDKGGHFAALEQPEILLKDIEDFVAEVYAREKSQQDPV